MAGSTPSPPGPALAVCGRHGAGKTTLLEQVVPALVRRGLAVAVLKHDVHGLDLDHPGKDSDRFFRAGADVALRGPGQALRRSHRSGDAADLDTTITELLADHDLVLIEGHKDTPLPKVWLATEQEEAPPEGVRSLLEILRWGCDRPSHLLELLEAWLPRAWQDVPLLGGVLVGGGASRMGMPKALLPYAGSTFAELAVAALAPIVREVVILGAGELPPSCAALPRCSDAPELAGPLAGMVSALRRAPGCAWIVAACDLPLITTDATAWLAMQRAPGRWAVLPRSDSGLEPLFALYEPQSRPVLEALAASGALAPHLISRHPKTVEVKPPPDLVPCWRNVNTPEDLARLTRRRMPRKPRRPS